MEESEMSVAGNILVRGSKGVIAAVLATSLTASQLPAVPKDVVSAQTMQNLQTALNGERNAHARYLAFAEKADQEGYGAVASLFRAAAAAEEVHGNNHERTIRGLGGSLHVEMQTPVPRSTRENLEAAINSETYERQKMYPEFVLQARKDAYVPAVVTLTQAQNTEEEHAKLFSEALNNLDALKGSKARPYYVCTVCGFTTVDLSFEKCKNCFKPKERYKTVS
jgi:rubrerythrin